MTERQIRQHGLWTSPITPAVVAGGIRLSDVQWSPNGDHLVWREERSGVGVLVGRYRDEAPRQLTDTLSVRARVGYGGGDFAVADDAVYFAEQVSGRLYRQALAGGPALPITPAYGAAASPTVSPDGRWLLYVHSYERVDRIAIVDTGGRHWPRVFAEGHDFFMQPCWSPDGRSVAWIAWDHPNMPWDGTRLYGVNIDVPDDDVPRPDGVPVELAGRDDVAIFQPAFTSDGRSIVYVSDESGIGRLVLRDLKTGAVRSVGLDGGDLGVPAWIQGRRTFGLAGATRAVVAANSGGFVKLHVADFETGELQPLESGYTSFDQPSVNPRTGLVAAIASSSTVPPRIVVVPESGGGDVVVQRSMSENIPAAALAVAEPYSWPTVDGSTVHGLYFAPASDAFESPGLPPLVVLVHGGPTSQVVAGWNAQAQFLATRGYAVLAVNYRGSTGYGRDYMNALRNNWGVCDVEDSVSGAQALAREGRVEPARTAIMGGSAGGFTVLQTMITHPEAFSVGVCMYGVANQFTLAAETHKFEERYGDSLIGPLPDAAVAYRERSPQFRASEIRRPIAIFQGEIDEVVPKNQSDVIVAALQRNGTPHEYHVYAGEGHGWRKAETIDAFYRAVERFLNQYLVYS